MAVEWNLLFAVLAFENDLLNLSQLTSACRRWAEDKTRPLPDLLVTSGWLTTADREFTEKLVERRLAKFHNDVHVTLNSIARGDVCEAIKEVEDSDIQQSIDSWPMASSALETIGETQIETEKPKSRYTWLSEVGKGGLGKVWLARDNDMSREVALKEIRPDKAGKSQHSLHRLIKEAQITGQLQHPNIVPVYELHRGHRPFYTMKLVKGETLTKAIKRFHTGSQHGEPSAPTMPRLLNAFIDVCEALAYSHSRGVIHRDLKPENIILGDYGEVMVLDWGLAKHIGSSDESVPPIRFTDDAESGATHIGATPGTPAYMAPEQASGRIDLIDHRTDIYGLGSILFEILTGQAPHQYLFPDKRSPQRQKPPLIEVTSADKPRSDSVSTDVSESRPMTDSLAGVLHHIANSETPRARKLKPSVPAELDAICAVAMSKRRENRYHDAKALIADIQHFLFDEPVSAIPAPLSSSARRWVKRHQIAVSTTAAALFIGLLSLAATAFVVSGKNDSLAKANTDLGKAISDLSDKNLQLEKATTLARENELRAEQKSAEAQTSEAKAIQNAMRADESSKLAKRKEEEAEANALIAKQNELKAAQNAARAQENAHRAEQNADNARRQSQLALKTLEDVIFEIQRGLKNVSGAREVQRKLLTTALRRLDQISDQFVTRSSIDRDTAVALVDLGDLFLQIGARAGSLDDRTAGSGAIEGAVTTANKLYSQALKINHELAAATPDDAKTQRNLSVSYNKLGETLLLAGQAPAAIEQFEMGLKISLKLALADPGNTQAQRDLSISYNQLGDGQLRAGDPIAALNSYRKGFEITHRLSDFDVGDSQSQYDLSVSCSRLGGMMLQFGQINEALQQYETGLAICERLASSEPENIQFRRQLSIALSNLGDVSSQLGQIGQALSHYQKGQEICLKLSASDPNDASALRHLSLSYNRIGETFLLAGKTADSLEHFQKFQEISQKLAAADPSDSRAQRDLWASYNNVGNVLLKTDKVTAALNSFQQGMDIIQKLAVAESKDAQTRRDLSISHNYLGDAWLRSGKLPDAVTQYEKGLELRQALAAANPNDYQTQIDLVVSFSKLGDINQQSKYYKMAAEWYEKAVEVLTAMDEKKQLRPANKKWIPTFAEALKKCRDSLEK